MRKTIDADFEKGLPEMIVEEDCVWINNADFDRAIKGEFVIDWKLISRILKTISINESDN